MRTLASIQRIVSVSPIEGAKDIERVQVLGWQLVSKKNEFKPDDLCVYIEIDSLLPKDNPAWAFMSKYNFRVKTAKKMGQISQGLALPLSLFPEISPFVQEGKDLTEFLKIEKYEKEEVEEASVSKGPKWYKPFMKYVWFRNLVLPLISKKKSDFPTHLIAKSDETRIQAMPRIFETHKDVHFTETEKIEGTSALFALEKNIFGYTFFVCSRELQRTHEDRSNWWRIAREQNLKKVLKKMMKDSPAKAWIIQGEIVGDRIQGNNYGYGPAQLDFFAYRLKKIGLDGKSVIYSPTEGKTILAQYGLKWVPIVGEIKLGDFTLDSLLTHVDGPSVLAEHSREGSVFVSVGLPIPVSFKAVSNKYLLERAKKEG